MVTKRSEQLFEEAKQWIPGGVNSPVRAFKSVGGIPRFIQKAKGAWLYDEDGNRYLDYINAWGPMILGHAFPPIVQAVQAVLEDSFSFGTPTVLEVEIAKQITQMMPSVQKVRMVNSGTEATMAAIRLARGYTGRDKIIKFAGCYHGHGDSFLIAAGSGATTFGIPDSRGVTKTVAKDTLVADYNNLSQVESLFEANRREIAAVILEPVVGNMGLVLPQPGFLEGLRKICTLNDSLLIFDEVMTGFRLAPGGAQELFGVEPDLTCLGKIIGGGLPVGAYGGKAEIMELIAPQGPVYQAGTMSGNPIAMAAGLATLRYLDSHKEIYSQLNQTTQALANGFRAIIQEKKLNYTIHQIGSMLTVFFTEYPVNNYND
ncbi:MAG: glutamate-1-semialdehyde 2,1-aminomutase, partial [Bacteroidia bacterium]|nr:glutamate-1-semialdehyde 2,1-aminomutase [Bacteroidia bacterium]